MATKYHINQNTGKYGACTATKIDCPLGDTAIHLEKLSDAIEYSEMILEEKYGKQKPLRKTPSASSIAPALNEKYPYPEAHILAKMDKVVYGLRAGEVPPSAISSLIGTKDRVSDFYAEAACYLGLAESVVNEKGNKSFSLTQDGMDYTKQDTKGREDILKRTISGIDLVQKIESDTEKDNLIESISKTHGENSETSDRKLSSMKSWARQINTPAFLEEIDEEDVNEKLSEGMEMYERKTADKSTAPNEIQGELCMTCFMTKPLTGVCPNCDE